MSCAANIYTVPVPGPQGPAGANGTNGADGSSAYTYSTFNFNMPAELGTVVVQVLDSVPFSIGQVVFVYSGGSQGYFLVTSRPTNTSLALRNLRDTPNNHYLDNSPAGTLFPIPAKVSPAGPQGPDGDGIGSSFLIANNLSEGVAPTMRTNLGLGTVATFTQGNANSNIPKVDDAAGLTAGESVWATANGIESKDAASARTALGLGSVAVLPAGQTNGRVPRVDDAGGLTNGEVVFATASGLESVDATTAKTRLGISTVALPIVLIRHREANNTTGGAFNSGAVRTVPLNQLIVDSGGIVISFAASDFRLPAGTYRYEFGVMGYATGTHQGWLYNVDTSAILTDSYGTVTTTGTDPAGGISPGYGRFTLAVATTLRLQAQCTASSANGFGNPVNFGVDNIYSYIQLEKES